MVALNTALSSQAINDLGNYTHLCWVWSATQSVCLAEPKFYSLLLNKKNNHLWIYTPIKVYSKKALITWSFHENFYNFMLGEQRDLSICFTLPLQYFVRSQFRDLFELYLRIHWWCTYPFSNFLCTKDFICKIRIWKVWNCILVFPLKGMVAAVARENFLSDRPVATFPFLFTVFLPGPAITSPWWAMSSCSFSLHTTSNL